MNYKDADQTEQISMLVCAFVVQMYKADQTIITEYSKTCVKRPLSKRPKIVFQDQLSLTAGQKYCRMYSAKLSTFIKLPFVIKVFVLSIFEWPFYTGFTVYSY